MSKSFFSFENSYYYCPFKIYNHPIYFQGEQIANLNENLKEFEGEVTYPTGRKTSQLRYSSSETKKILMLLQKILQKSSPKNLQHLSKLFVTRLHRFVTKKRIVTLNFRDNFVRISHTLLRSFDPVSKNRYVNRVKPKVSRTWAIYNNSFGSNKSLPHFAIETRIQQLFFFFARWFN